MANPSLSQGINNTAIGFEALLNNTTGYGNTAVGAVTLQFSTGDANTAIGEFALNQNTNGNGTPHRRSRCGGT